MRVVVELTQHEVDGVMLRSDLDPASVGAIIAKLRGAIVKAEAFAKAHP